MLTFYTFVSVHNWDVHSAMDQQSSVERPLASSYACGFRLHVAVFAHHRL